MNRIPTNLITGFLGVGKTTAILHLLKQKPPGEFWAVLVNEFGEIGLDGELLSHHGATVRQVPGGCMCCVAGVPTQVTLTKLIRETRPDRLLIEPTGLGHPKKLLDLLQSDIYRDVLELKASICLINPQHLLNEKYTSNANFHDQIQMSEILIANQLDIASEQGLTAFKKLGQTSGKLITQTSMGKIDQQFLTLDKNPHLNATFPHSHHHHHSKDETGFYSKSWQLTQVVDFDSLLDILGPISVIRLKGIVQTNQGAIIVNKTETSLSWQRVNSNENYLEAINDQDNWGQFINQLAEDNKV